MMMEAWLEKQVECFPKYLSLVPKKYQDDAVQCHAKEL
jgi:hypothetical protein